MQLRVINNEFVSVSSALVYKVAMPIFMFLAISNSDLKHTVDIFLFGFYSLAVTLTVIVTSFIAHIWLPQPQRGVFVQGAFRGNHAIVALAIIYNLYGQQGLGLGSAMVAIAAIINNLYAPIVFAIFKDDFELSLRRVSHEIFMNPMMLSLLAGGAFSLSGIGLPHSVAASLKQFASISLPLALLCIGATLSLRSLWQAGSVAIHASVAKLFWMPLIFMSLAHYFFEFDALQMGILFICLGVPTAAVSFVLARLTNSDDKLASNIVLITTFMSLITITLGLFFLQQLGWV